MTELIERRKHPRQNPSNLSITLLNGALQHPLLECMDLSESGIRICSKHPENTSNTSPGHLLRLKIDTSNAAIETEGKVKWFKLEENNRFLYGIEFNEPQENLLRTVQEILTLKEIEGFLNCKLPQHIQTSCKKLIQINKLDPTAIMAVIDFEKPFLKTEKFIIGTILEKDRTQSYGIGMGIVTLDDTRGHYNDTIFLAFCGWLMASTASIHLAVLAPKTAPQVIEAIGVKPIFSPQNKNVWKPHPDGTRFFVETRIIKKKLSLAVVNTDITFGDIRYGTVDELKLLITPRESIFQAKNFPSYKSENTKP